MFTVWLCLCRLKYLQIVASFLSWLWVGKGQSVGPATDRLTNIIFLMVLIQPTWENPPSMEPEETVVKSRLARYPYSRRSPKAGMDKRKGVSNRMPNDPPAIMKSHGTRVIPVWVLQWSWLNCCSLGFVKVWYRQKGFVWNPRQERLIWLVLYPRALFALVFQIEHSCAPRGLSSLLQNFCEQLTKLLLVIGQVSVIIGWCRSTAYDGRREPYVGEPWFCICAATCRWPYSSQVSLCPSLYVITHFCASFFVTVAIFTQIVHGQEPGYQCWWLLTGGLMLSVLCQKQKRGRQYQTPLSAILLLGWQLL